MRSMMRATSAYKENLQSPKNLLRQYFYSQIVNQSSNIVRQFTNWLGQVSYNSTITVLNTEVLDSTLLKADSFVNSNRRKTIDSQINCKYVPTMSNSSEFQRFKQLYHQENYSIQSVSIEGDSGELVFKDPSDNSEISVTGDSEDFVHALWRIKRSVRNGEDVLIDVTATPAGSIEQYYENTEYFLPDDPTLSSEDEMNRVIEKILTGKTTPLTNVNLRNALNAVLKQDMTNSDLHLIIENYYEVLAYQLIQLKGFLELFQHRTDTVTYNHDRFMDYYHDIDEILRLEYLATNPEQGYRSYRQSCITDIEHLTKQLLSERTVSLQEWRALLADTGTNSTNTDSEKILTVDRDYIEEKDIPNHAHGTLDAEMTVRRILKQYAYYYETAKYPLRDIVSTLLGPEGPVELDSTQQVVTWLKNNEDLSWTDAIVPALRNGPSHLSVEIDEDNGSVRILDGSSRSRNVEKELPYTEVIELYSEFVDLVFALIWSFTLTDQMLQFEYLKSDDFKFRVIENLPGDVM